MIQQSRGTERAPVSVCGRFLRIREPTGTQRSSGALLKATLRTFGDRVAVYGQSGTPSFRERIVFRPVRFHGALLDHLWEQIAFPSGTTGRVLWTLMGTGPVYHPGKRHVMVVHDLNYMILPHVFGRAFRIWYRFACGAAAQRADVVVCFTNYVSATIQERLGIPADRIRVIPQGPGLVGLEKPLESLRSEVSARPYFLCVGSLQPHKNLAGVLAAWEMFKQRHDGYALKVVGRAQDGFASLGLDLARLSQDVEFTGYLSDEDLVGLYRGATGFLYPSIEEGFGLPVVESFYCGCPVITSNQSCLPEVAGDAALLVDPSDPKGIADSMALLAESPTKSAELRSKGYNRAGVYTWHKAGQAMAEILHEAVHRVRQT